MASPNLKPAAQYLRMSTEQQTYSLAYQEAAIAAYAEARGYQIVQTYVDAGVSGLTLTARPGLRQLLADVMAGEARFEAVLIYDVSRWGRFQDPDQAAHYEFVCREAGVRIAYCAESFADQEDLSGTLMKHIKRAMAAEYSRDLSEKVTRSKRGLALQGYWPGGNPAFGLRRCVVGRDGRVRSILASGERNAVKGDRVIIVPGPADEIALVRRIFQLCAREGLSPNAIARRLNSEGAPRHRTRAWTAQRVRRVLRDELYLGVRILGRANVHLGVCERRPPQEWVRVSDAAEAIISRGLFAEAQRQRPRRLDRTDGELLADLRALLLERGRLSHNLIARAPHVASPGTYAKRFGGLAATYARIGYVPHQEQLRLTRQISPHRPGGRPCAATIALTDAEVVARLSALRARTGTLSLELIEVTPGLPRVRDLLRRFGTIAQVYELAGHTPSARQAASMGRRRRRAAGR